MTESNNTSPIVNAMREFLRLESASGILLILAAILAMMAQNSPASFLYDGLLAIPVEIRVGNLELAKPLLLWINDGLMAVFFLLVGLEVKREVLDGQLSDVRKVVLPVAGAVGGVAIPAAIYAWLNWGDPAAMRGWAVPTATDIAFALGVLGLLGSRVPQALKLFLMTLAIVDDLAAIIIIALFYSSELSLLSLSVAAGAIAALFVLNRRHVTDLTPYLIVGAVLWTAVLKSGVHATLAGVVLAMFIPFYGKTGDKSPLKRLEHDLHPTVAYGILPLFAFANAGVSLGGLSLDSFLDPVALGIALGLFVGKQLGVFGAAWLAVKVGIARLPEGVNWLQLYGVAVLCGIGFTMSLFVGSLAFEGSGLANPMADRLGILAGTLFSAVIGYALVRAASPVAAPAPAPVPVAKPAD